MNPGTPKKPAVPDQELIERYRNSHDIKYIWELYQRYTHHITIIALKYLKNRDDAQDAAMDLFEVLVRDLKKHHVSNFKAWLITVLKNLCFKKLKRARSAELDTSQLPSDDGFMESAVSGDLKEDTEEKLQKMEQLLEDIPTEQSRCIKLFFLEGKSYQDISAETGMTLKEVKSHLQNGKRNLRLGMLKKS